EGILICAENQSKSLHKVSEIYDRIAFAGVGRYNEFDSLRRAGVQHADIKGYQFSREDVDARSLANLYPHYIGTVLTHATHLPLAAVSPTGSRGSMGRASWPRWAPLPPTISCSTFSTTGRWLTRSTIPSWAVRRTPSPPVWPAPSRPIGPWTAPSGPRPAPWP